MGSDQRTVTLVITTLDYGGAETQLVQIAKRLRARGWNVTIVSLAEPREFVSELEVAEVRVRSLGLVRGRWDIRALPRLVNLLRDQDPDIVHSHMFHANILCRLARLFVRRGAYICTFHSIREGGVIRDLMYRATDRLANVTTTVSHAAVARHVRARAVPRDRILYVPNGIDTDVFRPDGSRRQRTREELGVGSDFVYLCVGRFIESKRHLDLVRAFGVVANARDDVILLLVGDGAQRTEIERKAAEGRLKGRVRVLGNRTDIPSLMNAADAFVSASEREGLPMTILEATAAGLPVAATTAGGTAEIVQDEEVGFLVESRDVDSLAAAMLAVHDLPTETRERIRREARRRTVASYNIEHVTSLWEDLYDRHSRKEV